MSDRSAADEDGVRETTKLLNDLQDIGFVEMALILFGSFVLLWLIKRILPFIAERVPSRLRMIVLGAVPILRLMVIIAAIFWIIPLVFNLTVQNVLVIAGAASVAIGFAFKDYASSLIAGIVALFERPYGAGDWVEIDDDYGEVVDVGFRAIQLRTAADNLVTVPHEKIWSGNIANANAGATTVMCIAHFHILPDHEPRRVEAALIDVGLTSAYLDYAKPVFVILADTEYGSHYQLKAYPFDHRDQFRFVSDLTARGKLALRKAGGVESAANCVPARTKDTATAGSGAS